MNSPVEERPERVSAGERRYQMVFDHSRDGIYVASGDGRLVQVNPAMVDLLGFSRIELLGLGLRDLFSDPEEWDLLREEVEREGRGRRAEVSLGTKDGRNLGCLLSVEAERAPDGTVSGFHGILSGARERPAGEEDVRQQTLHDGLTQLPNRTFFVRHVERLLERRRHRADYRFGVLVVALDRFKLVNDSLGHRAGDRLLVRTAERLSTVVRPEDVVARLGGDEFAVGVMDLDGPEDAAIVARRIRERLAEPFDVFGERVYVSARIGIALSEARYGGADEMIRDADTAAYHVKHEGGEGWLLFHDSMHARTVARFSTEMALRRAVENDEFVLHYQPLVALDSRRIVGFEALLRWDDPERGLLPPDEFLRVAEETRLIVPIGNWVLAEACRTLAKWRADLPDPDALVMSVNLSVPQLVMPRFGELVRQALGDAELPGEALRLEITETVFLENSDVVRRTLSELAGLGVRLCLDDFGTGYSSLGYLRDLPVDQLKIDRSFMSRLTEVPGGAADQMVGTILSLARRLDVEAIAEGVETEGQLRNLVRLGCGHGQGYLFSRPVTADRAWALVLKDREGRPVTRS